MSDFDRVAGKLRRLMPRGKRERMQRVVLVVEAQAKREAPVKRGTLRRSLTSRVERGGDRGVVGTNLKYARPVHEGSKPHIITARAKKALFWKGARHPVRSVRHPGNKPNKFLVRAATKSRPTVERELKGWGNDALGTVK